MCDGWRVMRKKVGDLGGVREIILAGVVAGRVDCFDINRRI
jgi:hypothetical protein